MLVNQVKGYGMLILLSMLSFSTIVAQKSIAEKLADEQLEAYNNMDLEGFLLPFSDSVKIYDDLKKYNVSDKRSMRINYERWFSSLESLNCVIKNRISIGNTIIDYESVTYKRRLDKEKNLEAIAIYKVANNKIQEVFFIRPE